MEKPSYLPDALFDVLRQRLSSVLNADGGLYANDPRTRKLLSDALLRGIEDVASSVGDADFYPLARIDIPGLGLKDYSVFANRESLETVELFANVEFLSPNTKRPEASWPLGTIDGLDVHFSVRPDATAVPIFMYGLVEVKPTLEQLRKASERCYLLAYTERIHYELPSNRSA